jgi:excisionase family DNA binding protein
MPSIPPPAPPLAVPAKEASRLLSLSLSRLYELLRAGELESYADGNSRRVTTASLHEYVERRLAANGGRWRQINAQPRQASKARADEVTE